MITLITATFPALNFPKEADYPTQEDWAAFSAAAELNYRILSGAWSDKSEEFKEQTNNLAQEIQAIGENAITAITLDTIEDLATYSGTGLVMVKDVNRGGTFVSKTAIEIDPNTGSVYTVNGGTVFAKSGGGFWVRQYSGAVNVKWFDGNLNEALLSSITVVISDDIVFQDDIYFNTNNTLEIYSGVTATFDNCRITAYCVDNVTIINNGTVVSANLNTTTEAIWIPNFHPTLNSPERGFIEFGGTASKHAIGFTVKGSGSFIGDFAGDEPENWQTTYAINKKGIACWFAEDITIQDIEISRFAGECVYVRSAKISDDVNPIKNVLFENIHVFDVGFNALNFNSASEIINARVINCVVDGFNYQALEMSSGIADGNVFKGSTNTCIQVGGLYAFTVTVTNNKIYADNITSGAPACLMGAGSISANTYSLYFNNNVIFNSKGASVKVINCKTGTLLNNVFDGYNLDNIENTGVYITPNAVFTCDGNTFKNKGSAYCWTITAGSTSAVSNTFVENSSGALVNISHSVPAPLYVGDITTYSNIYAYNGSVGFVNKYIDSYNSEDLTNVAMTKQYGYTKVGAYASGLGRMEFAFNKGSVSTNPLTTNLVIDATGGIYPGGSDATQAIGRPTSRWSVLYAYFVGLTTSRIAESYFSNINTTNAVIVSSDERLKKFIDITEAERLVAIELKSLIFKYKRLEAIDEETKGGKKARMHFGTNAQTVKATFEKHGLVAEDYSLLCYDEWDDVYEDKYYDAVIDSDGNVISESYVEKVKVHESGNQYSIRYEELLCFIISAM